MTRLAPCLLLLVLPASLAAAAGPVWTPMPGVDCYCTDSTGQRVEIGERACLTVGRRSFMGFCEMAQNVPIWRDTGDECVTG